MDGRVYDLAAHLLECVCDRLGSSCPDRACVVPGFEVSHENCCGGDRGGQLTINLVQRFPSRQFPAADLGTPQNCEAPYLVAVYQVEIVRCMPTGSQSHAPTCNELDQSAQATMLDAEKVWDGVSCCLQNKDVVTQLVGAPNAWVMGLQQTVNPQGGCVGSTLRVTVGMPNCLECP